MSFLQKTGAAAMRSDRAVLNEDLRIATRSAARRRKWGVGSFAFCVLLPTALFFIYTAFFQSRGYVSEMRITLRAAQESKASLSDVVSFIGRLGSPSRVSIQDSYVVLNYVKSSAFLNDAGGRPFLEKYYSSNALDYASRLEPDQKMEDLVKYWNRRLMVSVDTVSGIVTMKVEAFAPEDALNISRTILRLSENLVNEITIRNRSEALERAGQEVSLAGEKLAEAREKLLEFRNRNVLIDPEARAENLNELIQTLTQEKIDIETSLSSLSGVLSQNSPTQRIVSAKLAVINKQIEALKKNLTDGKSSAAVSAQIAAYERLKLDEQFAEKIYTISQTSYEKARQELDKQQVYLVVVVPPDLPEKTSYPRVFLSSAMLLAVLFIGWAIASLIALAINDQRV